MKKFVSIRYAVAAVAAITLLMQAPAAFAQGGGGGGRGGMTPLSEDGRTASQAITTETAELQTKVTEATTALGEAVYAAKLDEAAVKAKAEALGKAQTELAVARAKAFDKSRAKFTAEDITTLKRMPMGAGRAGGGRRNGGGGGGGN